MMHKRMTITLDETVYERLYREVGRGNISQFIERLIQNHWRTQQLEAGYRAMAQDSTREEEAQAWSEALIQDSWNEAR